MAIPSRQVRALMLVIFWAAASSAQNTDKHATQNVIFVMTDGLRWQEVFRERNPRLCPRNIRSRTRCR